MSLISSADYMIAWLQRALEQSTYGTWPRERYRLNAGAWTALHRPDCNAETALAFLKKWQESNDQSYLALARELYTNLIKMQNSNGSFPFSDGSDRNRYVNDNSEVSIFLIRMAENDTAQAQTYIAKALEVSDYVLSIQKSDGSWYAANSETGSSPLFTGHAVACLATAYRYADESRKSSYKTAIENGIDYIRSQMLSSGRVKTHKELTNGEYWRPPSSDQSICIRGLALAEKALPTDSNVSAWRTARHAMIAWLDPLIAPVGAVRDGYGESINGADIYKYTDHVYTTAFAIEAYYWSSIVDSDDSYLQTANKIVNFCEGNLYFSTNQDANGVLRGAWNIADENWDTSELQLNAGHEGGSNMIYSGWANAPIAIHLYTFAGIVNPDEPDEPDEPTAITPQGYVSVYVDSETVRLPFYLPSELTDNRLRVYADGTVYAFSLVSVADTDASGVKVYIDGTTYAIGLNAYESS